MVTTIRLSTIHAAFGVSIKVFMPFLDYKFFVLLSHVLSFNEFLRLQADRLAQNDVTFNFK